MLSFTEAETHGWSRNAATYDEIVLPATRQAFRQIHSALGDVSGKSVLDVACGTGHLARSLEEKGASVRAIDISSEMVRVAQDNFPSLLIREADCRSLPFKDQSFHCVTCCFGFLHMEDPAAAIAETHRVLKDDGRLVFTVWRGPDERGAFLGLLFNTLQTHADLTVPLPDAPPVFQLADEGYVEGLLASIGFRETSFVEFEVVWTASSSEAVVALIDKGFVRSRMILEAQNNDCRQRVIDALVEAAREHSGPEGFRMPNAALCISAMKE